MEKFNVIICMVRMVYSVSALAGIGPGIDLEILNAAMLVKSGMNSNYSKSHEV